MDALDWEMGGLNEVKNHVEKNGVSGIEAEASSRSKRDGKKSRLTLESLVTWELESPALSTQYESKFEV